MNAVYGPKDRARLTVLADILAATNPSSAVLGAAIADKLRTELPDLDDLTIGRVLVVLADGMATLFLEEVTSLHLTWGRA